MEKILRAQRNEITEHFFIYGKLYKQLEVEVLGIQRFLVIYLEMK